MKKIKIGLILLSLFISTNIVKADTINVLYPEKVKWLFSNHGAGTEESQSTTILYPSVVNSKYDIEYMYQYLMNEYNENYKENYPYYIMKFMNEEWQDGSKVWENTMDLYMFEEEPTEVSDGGGNYGYNSIGFLRLVYDGDKHAYYQEIRNNFLTNNTNFIRGFDENIYFNPMYLYDSNFEIKNTTGNNYNVESINLEINDQENYIIYKNSSFDSEYTEVNLDNYKYVLLSLKNYNQSQAFQTNLQVKGQIGITPIYNFGQTSKDSITGTQVQDRCNVNYESYTNYPFYIIQSDLQNNAIYAVKECTNGSSFKFDNTIFNVTYITEENEESPTVTINGKTYNVIPYGDLPSTATKNEENGYIPGESGSASDTGGLDSAIKGAQKKLGEIWNTITYFTDFIGQIFSSLPSEVHTILLSAFTIMVILGIIKIFLGH